MRNFVKGTLELNSWIELQNLKALYLGQNILALHQQIFFTSSIDTRFVPGFHPYKVFPSSNAFLFSLKPFSDKPKKLDVLLEKRHQALHIHRYRGPCWGEERQELCFNDQNVATGIIIGGVFNVSGITDATVSKYFTGQTSFQADDLQVFVIGGRQQSIRIECVTAPAMPDNSSEKN